MINLKMTEDSYISNRGFVSNDIDLATIVVLDAAGKNVTGNYVIKTQSGVLLVK